MENVRSKLAIAVISCDEYSDLWDDFFNLKERFWPDCCFDCYLVNNILDYSRKGVKIINCGVDAQWSDRVRIAINEIPHKYIIPILEDHLISNTVSSEKICNILSFVESNKVDFLSFEPVKKCVLPPKEQWKFLDDFVRIPRHTIYGLDTSTAIWNKEYYRKIVGPDSYNAWMFEMKMCELSKTEKGYEGVLLWDPSNSLNINEVEVVRQGKFRREAIRYFRELGYDLNYQKRGVMSPWMSLKDYLKHRFSGIKYGRRFFKSIGRLLGIKFFSND